MPRRSKKGARRFSKRRASISKRRMRGGWRVLSGAALNDTSMNGPMNASLKQGGEYSVLHEGQHGGGGLVGAPAFQSEMLPESMVTAARTGGTLQAFSEIQGMKDQGGGGRRSQYGGQLEETSSSPSIDGGQLEETSSSPSMNGGQLEETSSSPSIDGGQLEETSSSPSMNGGQLEETSSSPSIDGGQLEETSSSPSMDGGRRRRGGRKSRRGGRKSRRRQGGGGNGHPADVSAPSMLLDGNSAKHAEGGMNPEWQLAKNPTAFTPK